MTMQKGEAVLLKIGNGASPVESFTTLEGVDSLRFVLTNVQARADTLASGVWRTLTGESGLQSLRIDAEGYFTDSAVEETLRGYAFTSAAKNFRLYFGNGDYVSGAFLVTEYSREGRLREVEGYRLRLESAGGISFVTA